MDQQNGNDEDSRNLPATTKSEMIPVAAKLAEQFSIPHKIFYTTIKDRLAIQKKNVSDAEILAFMIVCDSTKLNPFTREIYAIPVKGQLIPYTSIDGFAAIANRNGFDGCEFEKVLDEKGNLYSVKCRIYVKGRTHPTEVEELYSECKRNSDPWRDMPHRQLRHKAFMQCARYAFSISGIFDIDEAQDVAARIDSTSNHGKTFQNGSKKITGKAEPDTEPPEEEVFDAEYTEAEVPAEEDSAPEPGKEEQQTLMPKETVAEKREKFSPPAVMSAEEFDERAAIAMEPLDGLECTKFEVEYRDKNKIDRKGPIPSALYPDYISALETYAENFRKHGRSK